MNSTGDPETPGRTVALYVRLLNEGTDVFRPTQAIDMGNGLFKILATPDYDPDDEEWEFLPGTTVRSEPRINEIGRFLIAIRA